MKNGKKNFQVVDFSEIQQATRTPDEPQGEFTATIENGNRILDEESKKILENEEKKYKKFCPLTQQDCKEDCQLYINGKCSIAVIANEEHNILDILDETANHTANLAAAIIDKKDTL